MNADFQDRDDLRLAKKLLRLGTDDPICAHCQGRDVRCLGNVKCDEKVEILCGNCRRRRKPLSIEAADRKAERLRAAGYAAAACVVCGASDLEALEDDHVAGIANSGLREPLCANHHAIKSHEAESDPWSALRSPDPKRPALALQAAFEYGLAAVLTMIAAAEYNEHASRAAFFSAVVVILIGWATWNLAADRYFEDVLGPDYDQAIQAEIPR